jgi:hypothetical protein
MDCDQVAYEQVSTKAGKSGKVRSFVQAVARGQQEQQKAAAVKMKIMESVEKISEHLTSEKCKADPETKEEVRQVVMAAEEAAKTLTSVVQLEVIADGLEAQVNGLKFDS